MFLDPPSDDPFQPALFDSVSGRWWSRQELLAAANHVAARIATARGGLAVLLCRNSANAVASYLACVEAGCAVALLDARTPAVQLGKLFDLYRPEVCITVDQTVPPGEYVSESADAFGRLWWRAGGARATVPAHPDLAVLLSTSGTTGSPKLVRLSRLNVEANADSVCASLDLDPGERAMASLPMYYSYGLSVLNSHLRAGASAVLTEESVISPGFWKLLRNQGCTSMPGVPYTYDLLGRIGFENLEVPSLRSLTQAGGRLAPELVRRFHAEMTRRGGRFFVMYGQTEATARIACVPPGRLLDKLGAAGAAIPRGRLSVEADACAGGRIEGEIIYSGPNVMMGYAESRQDLARGDDLHGVLRTGDLGYLDEEGFLYLTGRSKRIGKVLGMRVNLDEVEARLRSQGPTAVVAGGDGLDIYCEYGDASLFSELARRLARDMRADPGLFRFHRLHGLPLNANGKIDYARLGQV
jgi:acyl-CoA synthetase (AMP-forming)/AMP-acid ligase II